MDDLFEYLKWRGDLPLSQVPLTPVDALILSELSYLKLDGIVPDTPARTISLSEASAQFLALPEKEQICRTKLDVKLLKACAETERFRHAQLTFFRNLFIPEEETQFAAVSFLLDDGTAFLAFRGTDYSLVGWKEDFNMSFADSIPAQREALRYTQEFASSYPLLLRLGGHSKGGNVAVYAASKASQTLQSRIPAVYNNDGPGFTDALMGDPGYLAMVPKIHTYIPQSSIIGMLLEHEEPYTVVKSRQVSLLQHEPYSWEVLGGGFVPMEALDENSRFLDSTLKTWLAGRTMQERNEFVDALYELLTVGEVADVRQMILPRNVLRYLRTLSTDEQMRSILSREFTHLFRTALEARRQNDAPGLPEGE
jgi:hypothetical protein